MFVVPAGFIAGDVPDDIAGRTIPAAVPGCVHLDLLAAGLIADPYLDENELAVGWVGRVDWRYETAFDWAGNHDDHIDLVASGLDTVATIELNGSAIGTLVERTTRFVMLLHLPQGQNAFAVRDAITSTIGTLPAQMRPSLTWDQGKEMSQHVQLRLAADLPIYFCDPHSPWQRGSNENTNGLLRQYMPKGTDLSVHSVEDLEAIAKSLNNRPRKTLGYLKPSEKLAELLATTP